MTAHTAQTLIEIVGWVTIGFCVGMALFEFLTRPRGPTGPMSRHLRDAPPHVAPGEVSETDNWRDAA